jgi:CDP-glycerol glycerophosphotransferase
MKDDYIVLFRTHAYTNTLLGVEFNDFLRDYSSYPVVNDLFKVADILVSDYSSCISDYCILERPIVCFAYDYEEYKAARGLNIDFRVEMPSGIKETEKEVIDHILSMDYDLECKKTKAFKDKYTYIGGHATEICVEKMFGKL